MNTAHTFIFNPGEWKGKGTIGFSMAKDVFPFTVHWVILPMEEEKIYFFQEIAVESFPEKMRNHFVLQTVSPSHFEIQLENSTIGKALGSGLVTPTSIAWEFRRHDQAFEGFEVYELQDDDSYKMHAEFTSGEGYRTLIGCTLERT